jgi:Tfp pilus assembly protein PilF
MNQPRMIHHVMEPAQDRHRSDRKPVLCSRRHIPDRLVRAGGAMCRVAILLIVCMSADPVRAETQSARSGERDVNVERMLAGQFVRVGTSLLHNEALSVQMIEAALIMADEAAKLEPDNAELWHYLLSVATLAEREDIARRAAERLIELDPRNDRVRLRLIRARIESEQTAEARAKQYEAHIQSREIPATVRSRLALDYALLERRRGHVDSFAHWLAEAVALDRANTAAAALAAGYFRLNVDDPVGVGELMLNLVSANPADISAIVVAANHFLDHGAFAAADRLFTLARRSYDALALVTLPSELITDQAIARWGAGLDEAALRLIRDHRHQLNAAHRARLVQIEPDMTPMERAERIAPVPPSLAAVEAALRSRRGDAEAAASLQRVIDLYLEQIEAAIEQAREDDRELTRDDRLAIARTWLELAWIAVWLSDQPRQAEQYLTSAREMAALTERAEDRIAGWILLREGDSEQAIELLSRYVDDDPAAALGHAMALLAQGRQRTAARELLQIARHQPGTLMGVWAHDQLSELLGRRVPISDHAAELNELMAAVPGWLDRLAQQPTTAFSARIAARQELSVYRPYEPIELDIEIVNHAPIPLAIDPDGPITPEVAVLVSVQLTGAARSPRIPPIIVSIDRRLRLEPRERLRIPIDLRWSEVGEVLSSWPLNGAMIEVKLISNVLVSPGGTLLPGILGSEYRIPPIRVDGLRATPEHIDQVLTQLNERADEGDRQLLLRIPLVAFILNLLGGQEMSEDDRERVAQHIMTISRCFRGFDPVSQAWLLSVISPESTVGRPLVDLAVESDHRLVRMALLLSRRLPADDPLVQATLRSADPTLRRIAQFIADSPDDLYGGFNGFGGDIDEEGDAPMRFTPERVPGESR